MGRKTFLLIACVAVFGGVAPAVPLDYQSQDRHVSVSFFGSAGNLSDSQQENASGFSPFDKTLDVTLGSEEVHARGIGSQVSSLSASGISATGTAEGFTGPPAGSSAGAGSSDFSVTFRTVQPHLFTLDFDSFSELGDFSFTGPSLNFVNPSAGFFIGNSIHESGVLQPGDYTFAVHIQNGAAAEGTQGTFNLNFNVAPEPSTLLVLAVGVGGFVLRRRWNGAR